MMKAIGYTKTAEIHETQALSLFETDMPEIGAYDVLVKVHAISVNPVDTKLRRRVAPENGHKILGYDASGIIEQVGENVKNFKVGDEVFYAGDITRAGTNAEYHAVDSRIVGKKPQTLSFAETAAMPLTSITAWELLFDSLKVKEGTEDGESILIIGGAGGVGSILIQLAKQLTGLNVIATASRSDTIEWVKEMGADHVINHRESLVDQLKALDITPKYVAALTGTAGHFDAIIELIKPRGHVAIIDDPDILDINAGKPKSVSFSWEFMFTRSMFETDDIEEQSKLLNRVSALLDDGTLKGTATKNLGAITAKNLIQAHEIQESGRAIGKTVLEGFEA